MNPTFENPVGTRSSTHSEEVTGAGSPRRSRLRRERRDSRWNGAQVSVLIVGALLAIALVIAVFVLSANLR